jgi:hypothetical protein
MWMDTRSQGVSKTESVEARRRRQQEDESLGRMAWAESTRTGANVPAATTADLVALGARVRAGLLEGLTTADAVVRSAANTATFGFADNAAAGANAVLGMGGEGDFPTRYGRLYQEELDKDQTYRRERPIATAVGELGMTALTAGGVAKKGAMLVSTLPAKTKGFIGERMSDGRTLLSGDIPIKHRRRLDLEGGGHTFTDHQTTRGRVVEAKLGPTARLSKQQRRAQAQLGPRYRYDHWSFDEVGRVIGGAAAGAQQGLDEVSDRVRTALEARKRR